MKKLKNQKSKFLFAILAILISVNSQLIGQAKVSYESNFDKERLLKIDDYINRQIKLSRIGGASALLIKDGKIIYNKAFGFSDVENKKQMQTDNIFRIASQTKAITSLAAMMLWEEGKFLLDDPISIYIPAFISPKVLVTFNETDSSYTTQPASREITVRDLMRHTSGLAYQIPYLGDNRMASIYNKAKIPCFIGYQNTILADKINELAKLPIQHNPGEAFTYGLSTDVLGYLVEIWSGQSLDEFFKSRIFDPLEMSDTYFNIPKEKQHRLVSLYQSRLGNELIKVNYSIYDNAHPDYPNTNRSYFSGGGGLSSTTSDYSKFLILFLNKGVFKNKRLLSPKTIDLMMTNQLKEGVPTSPHPPMSENFQFGLGFALETEKNDFISPLTIGSFSWDGAFSTYYWVDPKENLIGVFYTQVFANPYWSILKDQFKILTYQSIIK